MAAFGAGFSQGLKVGQRPRCVVALFIRRPSSGSEAHQSPCLASARAGDSQGGKVGRCQAENSLQAGDLPSGPLVVLSMRVLSIYTMRTRDCGRLPTWWHIQRCNVVWHLASDGQNAQQDSPQEFVSLFLPLLQLTVSSSTNAHQISKGPAPALGRSAP